MGLIFFLVVGVEDGVVDGGLSEKKGVLETLLSSLFWVWLKKKLIVVYDIILITKSSLII